MSLRSKLLALFLALAVAPLVAVGALGYVQSLRALRAMLARQTAALAGDAARLTGDRFARLESDALLLGENAETQRLYATPPARRGVAAAQADTFLRSAWQHFGSDYRSLELRDAGGGVLYHLGGERVDDRARVVPIERAVRNADGATRGTLVLGAALETLLPRDALDRRVGDRGRAVVVDRATGRVLYHSRGAWLGQPVARLAAAEGWSASLPALAQPRGTFALGRGDSAQVASFVSAATPAWTIIVTASVAEFAPPFERARSIQLLVVLGVTGAITLGFAHLVRRATRSLEELTVAADAVGRGDLTPSLPRVREHDEVGRLTLAFDSMVGRVRDMLDQVASTRQMALLGEFASQIAHEIRNPLTSVKLNLQGLTRDARDDLLPPASARSVDICLREIDRLDGVVRGVLALAQSGTVRHDPCALHAILDAALHVVTPQAAAQHVAIERDVAADDAILGDAPQLQGALLNLLLNALAVMPDGGTLRVRTERVDEGGAPVVCVHVIDSGPGVAPKARERIFRPFHTTRAGGTGLGLPIARRTIEAHGGRLTLGEAAPGRGAAFVVVLPLEPPLA